ncbi:MAG: 2-oxo-4-hydroxy-4-carboxy-5-ureidoimidazoline decarboxylase [Candidatus Limnocylindria bacterium]
MAEHVVPAAAELDLLPSDAFVERVAPLFEDARAFAARLAARRPFRTDDGLLAAARETALGMPAEDQRRLLDAHPRIGAAPETMSDLSRGEQGAEDREADGTSIAAELAELNEAYEERFGFRFVIFVAGRSRSQVVPLLEQALRSDPEAELRRGLEDALRIAADRLGRMRRASEGVTP